MRRVTARINSTARKRIRQQDIVADFRQPEGDRPFAILVALDRTTWTFPGTATVVLEVKQRSARMRFELGTVGAPIGDCWLPLERLDPSVPPHIRLKVVDQDQCPGRLLAASRFFVPIKEEGKKKDSDRSILHIRPYNLEDEVWRVDFSDESPPILSFNQHLASFRERLQAGTLVASLVLPLVVRMVLKEIRARPNDESRENDWQRDWLRWCKSLGVSEEQPTGDLEYEEWEDEVVKAFCRKHEFVKGASRVLDAGGWR